MFIDAVGTVLTKITIPANDEGYSQAVEHGNQFGEVEWRLEGTGPYGHGVADALLKTGAVVYEVLGACTQTPVFPSVLRLSVKESPGTRLPC